MNWTTEELNDFWKAMDSGDITRGVWLSSTARNPSGNKEVYRHILKLLSDMTIFRDGVPIQYSEMRYRAAFACAAEKRIQNIHTSHMIPDMLIPLSGSEAMNIVEDNYPGIMLGIDDTLLIFRLTELRNEHKLPTMRLKITQNIIYLDLE